jgi:dihydrofolate reductase
MSRKLNLFIAASLDGFIAKHDDNIDFLKSVERAGEDYGYAAFLESIDTIIWGRKTFDKVLGFGIGVPHAGKKVYVISRSQQGHYEHAEYNQDVVQLVTDLKQREGKDIYCDGGSEIIALLLKQALVDRIIVSVIPHLLGDGIRLFREGCPEQSLVLESSISFPSGLVQLRYDVVKN